MADQDIALLLAISLLFITVGAFIVAMGNLILVQIPEQQSMKTDFCRDYFYASDKYLCPTNTGVKEFVCNSNLKECYFLSDSKEGEKE